LLVQFWYTYIPFCGRGGPYPHCPKLYHAVTKELMNQPESWPLNRRLCIAPMMEWTDRHCRYLLRLIAPGALLYTEMVPTGAILRGDAARFLRFDPAEHPVALQLGGAEPGELARAAAAGAAAGYDEINLNVGCPSDRVRSGRFGACLMAEPALVAQGVAAMRAAAGVPVTVKTRIGIDDSEDYAFLRAFVETVAAAGCTTFIIHARKAWLRGLSPKENREIPPLRYELVHRLKADLPGIEIILNGGIRSVEQALEHKGKVDGVMIGREAYQNPMSLAAFERALLGRGRPAPGGREVVRDLVPYIARELAEGTPLKAITRHMLGLFNGLPGARRWRRHLSEAAPRPGAGIEVVEAALTALGPPARGASPTGRVAREAANELPAA
jgi:tRNA-dihydrouridine synthase A